MALHDPADFGLTPIVPPPPAALAGSMRTGLTEALLTDAEDDSYDLSWLHRLPSDMHPAIRELRRLLEHDPDPIDRHFMFCELEDRLYRSRDVFSSALAEYDDTCRQHDAEMEGIRAAFLAKFGKIPVLETYRQMAIRQQKVKDWQQAIWWVERGLALYGEHAARPESVDDLRKRLTAYQAKMIGPDQTLHGRRSRSRKPHRPTRQSRSSCARPAAGASIVSSSVAGSRRTAQAAADPSARQAAWRADRPWPTPTVGASRRVSIRGYSAGGMMNRIGGDP